MLQMEACFDCKYYLDKLDRPGGEVAAVHKQLWIDIKKRKHSVANTTPNLQKRQWSLQKQFTWQNEQDKLMNCQLSHIAYNSIIYHRKV